MTTRTLTTLVQVTRPDGTTFVSGDTLSQAVVHYPTGQGYRCKPLITHVDAADPLRAHDDVTAPTPVAAPTPAVCGGVLSHQDRDLLLHAQLAILLEKLRAAVAAHWAGQPDPLVYLIDHLDKLGLLPPPGMPPEQLLGQARECAVLVEQIADRMVVRMLAAGGESS